MKPRNDRATAAPPGGAILPVRHAGRSQPVLRAARTHPVGARRKGDRRVLK